MMTVQHVGACGTISISIHTVRHSKEISHPYLKSSRPEVQLEVLGDHHSFEDVANLNLIPSI
jgi:hypothetical protein